MPSFADSPPPACLGPALAVALLAALSFAPTRAMANGSSAGLADPTRPPAAWVASRTPVAAASAALLAAPPASAARPVPVAMPLVLQALQWRRGSASTALINGQLVHPGDVIEGRRVVAIEADGVRLQRAGSGTGPRHPVEYLRLIEAEPKAPPGSLKVTRGAAFQSQEDATRLAEADPAAGRPAARDDAARGPLPVTAFLRPAAATAPPAHERTAP